MGTAAVKGPPPKVSLPLRKMVWGLLVLIVAAGGGIAAWPSLGGRLARTFGLASPSPQTQGALEKLEVYGRVPEFSLIERSGRQITRADLMGKVWIVNFFYTECTDTCPLQSANMARLQDYLSEEPDVRLASISVDPEHDAPKVLSEYANRFRADPERWLFLTGSRDAIHRLAIEGFRLGVVDPDEKVQQETDEGRTWLGSATAQAHPFPDPKRKPLIHSSRFVLVDRQAQIRGYYHGTDSESLERLRQNTRIPLREKPRER